MKRETLVLVTILASCIAIGGGCRYFLHLVTLSNEPTDGHSQQPVVPASIDDPLLHTDSFQHSLTVYNYVLGLSEKQISNELHQLTAASQQRPKRVPVELKSALLEKLVLLNPAAAMKFALAENRVGTDLSDPDPWPTGANVPPDTETAPNPYVRNVFREWALQNLDDAVNNAKSLSEDTRKSALIGILASQSGESLATYRTIANQLGEEEQVINTYWVSLRDKRVDDPELVWNDMIQVFNPDRYDQYEVLMSIAQQWFERDEFAAIDRIRACNLDEDSKSRLVNGLIYIATEESPLAAFQYAQELPAEGQFRSTLRRMVDRWASSEPAAAYQAIINTENSALRDDLIANVVENWASVDPHYVLENQSDLLPELQDLAVSEALNQIAQTSPLVASELAIEHKESLRWDRYFLSAVMRELISQDVEEAINWVRKLETEKNQQVIWEALITQLVHSDPRRAFDMALDQPRREDSWGGYEPTLEATIMSAIVREDLNLALELLPKVREGKEEAYSAVGEEYVESGEFKKAVELGLELPTFSEQARYLHRIVLEWVQLDPDALIEAIRDLPTADLRANLARNCLGDWIKTNFTPTQIEVLEELRKESDRDGPTTTWSVHY